MTDVSASLPQVPQTSPAAESAEIPTTPSFTGTKHKIDWGDGNSEELAYDDLISNYKMTRKEAKELKGQMGPVMEFLSALQSGDLDSLQHLQIPEDKMLDFAERVLTKKVEWEQMSPQQKAMIQKEKELAERERRYKEFEAAEAAKEAEQVNQKALSQVQDDIVSAISELGLQGRPTPRLIRRVAEQLKAQIESNSPMDARKASRHEWDGIQQELSEFQMMMLNKDPVKFVENLPKEIRKAIRDYEVKAGSPFKRADNEEGSNSSSNKKGLSWEDLEKMHGDKNNLKRKVR